MKYVRKRKTNTVYQPTCIESRKKVLMNLSVETDIEKGRVDTEGDIESGTN